MGNPNRNVAPRSDCNGFTAHIHHAPATNKPRAKRQSKPEGVGSPLKGRNPVIGRHSLYRMARNH